MTAYKSEALDMERMEKQSITLQDIIDIPTMQKIQDGFAEVAKVTTVIIGPNGEQITKPSNLSGFCALMQHSELGLKKCLATNEMLCSRNISEHRQAIAICPHSGLTTAASPIIVNEQYLGSWIIGQVVISKPAEELVVKTAQETGIENRVLLEAIHRLPVMSKEEFDGILRFFSSMNETLLKISYINFDIHLKNNELNQARQRIKKSLNMYRQFVDSTDVGMFIADHDTGVILMNNRYDSEYLKMEPQDIVGVKCWDLHGKLNGNTCSFCPMNVDIDSQERPYHWEFYNPSRNIWLHRVCQAIDWVDGRRGLMVTYWDVTLEHENKEKMQKLAYYDLKLDLPNSNKLQKDLSAQAAVSYLLCLDINALRHINDVYGRDIGDLLLGAICNHLKEPADAAAELYRIGGDEFCLWMKEASLPEIMDTADRIVARFNDNWALELGGKKVLLTCDVSVAVIPYYPDIQNQDMTSIIEHALYIAHDQNKIVLFDKEQDQRYRLEMQQKLTLIECIRHNMAGFSLRFQPIIDAKTDEWCGLEALCRWKNPDGKNVPPGVFIGEAEKSGWINHIDLWVMEHAISVCKGMNLDRLGHFYLSVNLSPHGIMNANTAMQIRNILERTGFPGEKLVVEITESIELNFDTFTTNFIHDLKEMGIRISLDDFGTGYSSFHNLKDLPVDYLKTDRSFLSNALSDHYTRYFLTVLTDLAHTIGIKLIIEGVETIEQRDFARACNVDFMQGYYYSMPLTTADMKSAIKKRQFPIM